MVHMKIRSILVPLLALALSTTALADKLNSKLFLDLPEQFNSPASFAADKQGNIYFTSPNFHNEALLKDGLIKKAEAPTIGKVTANNTLSTWYRFKPEDMLASTGKIAPFGIAFGPDGNAYVADMQLWFGGKYQSRILRINVKKGKAISTDVVATGFLFPNAVVWKGNDLFVSDTQLANVNGKQVSGVYKLNLSELDPNNPAQITPYEHSGKKDPHLFETFISNGKLTFGANGLAIDGEGSLYTAIMEEGSIMKTTMDANNKALVTRTFATGMTATDGMSYDPTSNKLYVADLFANAVFSVDMQGKVTLLAQNGDSNGAHGELDAPGEVIVRGNEVLVTNFNAVFDSPEMRNKSVGRPFTLAVIKLP